ncbi:DUF397 domain-containing protein [Actinomadura macra]|uniref:DUF397 domain-containing protein n=1 Tax=Actinomadura macra TaxID=46164 RepID=UPI000A020111|nr:DUF397 domain-containing protein [Actinomadura macra]
MTGADQNSGWRKSSHSGDTGGECVELTTMPWRRSSYSTGTGGECVEVAALRPAVAVRDSKDPQGPRLSFTGADWTAFTGTIKAGRHDLR